MTTSSFTDIQSIAFLKQAQAGSPQPSLCREHRISNATFYKSSTRIGDMDASLMARLVDLDEKIDGSKLSKSPESEDDSGVDCAHAIPVTDTQNDAKTFSPILFMLFLSFRIFMIWLQFLEKIESI